MHSQPANRAAVAVTERDLDILEAILRYRLSSTSELVRIVGGGDDITLRRF